ncbi:hypothetical protein BJ741DRAFT_706174, partial [Chytriomyces cf. hyalinus JEL632]
MPHIFCVLNDSELRPFSVTINPTNAIVDELKTAIRAASSPELDYWAAANLTLVRIFKEGEGGVKVCGLNKGEVMRSNEFLNEVGYGQDHDDGHDHVSEFCDLPGTCLMNGASFYEVLIEAGHEDALEKKCATFLNSTIATSSVFRNTAIKALLPVYVKTTETRTCDSANNRESPHTSQSWTVMLSRGFQHTVSDLDEFLDKVEGKHIVFLDGYVSTEALHVTAKICCNAWRESLLKDRRLVVVCSASSRGKINIEDDILNCIEEFL